jgi:hypothetical protein
MIELNEIKDKFPRSFAQFKIFLDKNAIECVSASVYIYFLDSKGLYIGISVGLDATDWLCELNSVILDVRDSRKDAESFCIAEAFLILEKELNRNI